MIDPEISRYIEEANRQLLAVGIGGAATLISVVAGIVGYGIRATKHMLTEHVSGERETHDSVGDRLHQLELRTFAAPSPDTMTDMAVSMQRLAGDIGVVRTKIEAIERHGEARDRSIERIERILIEDGRK